MTDLDEALKRIEDQFGEGSVIQGDAVASFACIKTGAVMLDVALGGGIIRGRIHEVFGDEGSGKTTLIYSMLAQAQLLGPVAFIDVEHAMNHEYAESCGLCTHDMYISQPQSGEEALEIADQLVQSGAFSMIAVDSVAALVPQAELDGDMADMQVGLLPRLMGKAMRKLAPACERTGTTMVFINQNRMKIGGMGGKTQPGGNALKFAAAQRISIAKKYPAPDIKRGDEVIGHVVTAKTIKNKMAASGKKADFDIIYGQGVVGIHSLIDLGIAEGVIQKNGSFLTFGEIKGQGKSKLAAKLKEESMLDELEKACQTT